jgi:glycosyltransferase involved in cell wall biosynthesis
VKVLCLTTNWPTEASPVNGVFVQEHARVSAEHAEVVVLYLERAPAGRGLFDVEPLPGEQPPVWRVRYRRLGRPMSYAAFVGGALSASRRLGREGFEPDVVHAHSHLSALPALVIGRISRAPVVYTEHWSIFLPDNPGGLSAPMRLAARVALERADLVLPVSVELANALRRLAPRARVRVVPNAVDERLFHPPTRSSKGAEKRLLTVGLLDNDAKGIDLLLEAVAVLDGGIHLDVVGDGSKRPEYEDLARELGVASSVDFHGLLTKTELATRMRQADLFVLGSRYENNPCVLLEAMASGLPVVATRVGGVPELVDADVGMLAEPGDASGLARSIGRALEDLESFDARAIGRRAHERYGRASVGAKLLAAYEDVLTRRAR